MHKSNFFILWFVAGVLLCGCNKQAKINSKKIDDLSQRITRLEENQNQQLKILQGELTELAPELNKVNSAYFEKDRDAALFFHTNTLYLLLTIGKQIETQLQLADSERETQNSLEYTYNTNELSALYLCTAQISQSLIQEQKAIVDSVNAETRNVTADSQAVLLQSIKTATTPDPALLPWRQSIQADLARLEQKLDTISSRLANTNSSLPIH
jgi:hypothetical protein